MDPAHQSVTVHPPLSTSPARADTPPREDSDASSIHRPFAKKQKCSKGDEVDDVIVSSLKSIQERWIRKDAEAHKQAQMQSQQTWMKRVIWSTSSCHSASADN